MKREKQIKESKEMIKSALFKLMKSKEFDEITMSEIALEAGLVRMTLYRHFKDKEQILLYCFEDYYERALLEMKVKINPNLNDLLRFRFKMLKESPYTNLLMAHNLLNQLIQRVGLIYIQSFKGILPEIDDAYRKSFVMGGIDAMTIRWIEGGMNEPYTQIADEVANILIRFRNKGLEVQSEA